MSNLCIKKKENKNGKLNEQFLKNHTKKGCVEKNNEGGKDKQMNI